MVKALSAQESGVAYFANLDNQASPSVDGFLPLFCAFLYG